MKQLLTVREAAVLARRTVGTIYRWIEQGRLTTLDSDRGVLVRPAQVQQVAAATRRGRPPRNAGNVITSV